MQCICKISKICAYMPGEARYEYLKTPLIPYYIYLSCSSLLEFRPIKKIYMHGALVYTKTTYVHTSAATYYMYT